jgi:hypothetical protein
MGLGVEERLIFEHTGTPDAAMAVRLFKSRVWTADREP